MGIARRKTGKISKAVTKSISKGGVSCAQIRYFIRSHTKIRQKTTKCLEKRSDASKKFFYGFGTYRRVLCRTAEMRVTCVTPVNVPKMLIMRHSAVTWIYLQNARKQDECNALILNSSKDCSKIYTPTDVCPFRVHIANLTEPAGWLPARKVAERFLSRSCMLMVFTVIKHRQRIRYCANRDCIGKQSSTFVRGRLGKLMLPRRCVPWLLQTADSFTSIPLERAAFKIDDHKDMLHFQRRFVV